MARRRWRLRTTIRTFVLTLVAALGGAALAVTWVEGHASIVEVSRQLIETVALKVESEVGGHLDAPQRALRLTRELVQDGAVPLDEASLRDYFVDFLDTHPDVSALRYRARAGLRVEAVRDPAGMARAAANDTLSDTDSDAEWYLHWAAPDAVTGSRPSPYWSAVTIRHDLRAPVLTGSLPVLRDGSAEGVVAVELSLVDLSHFLAGVRIGRSGAAFIVDADGRILAHPDTSRIVRADDDALSAAYALHELEFAHRSEVEALMGVDSVRAAHRSGGAAWARFRSAGETYLGSLAPLARAPEGSWHVGVVVPEDDFLGELKRTMAGAAVLLALLLAVAFLVGDRFSRQMAGALGGMVRETGRVRALDFTPARDVDSPFEEVHDVLTAFEGMKVGLRSFSRYVPVRVVKRLVRSGVEARPGGERREVTLLFTDIERFTDLSEGLDPEELTERLGAYFTVFADVIQDARSEGVIDKYVGDALMAFWGAPEPIADHARRACLAALDCVAALGRLDPSGRPFGFHTRFGLHTDTVLVGNMGAEDRLNYTCVGDGVNLASRVEGLNKRYGTSILVTETTRAAAGAGLAFRRVDSVAVKGRATPVDVHELLGREGSVDGTRLRRASLYERALTDYQEARFETAREALLGLQQRDDAEAFLLERVEACISRAPGANWSGVLSMDHK